MKTETPSAKLPVVLFLLLITMLIGSAVAAAVEVGEPAPDFTLQSTTGKSISLSQFKGKKNVLIEFYSFDFNPI
jgi:cytochrome oxidase Cu insertion factor (SCO1/SenC/PrrC family)